MEPIIPSAGVKRAREDAEDTTQQPLNTSASTVTDVQPPAVSASSTSQTTNPSEGTSAAPTPATQKATPTAPQQPPSNPSPLATQPGKSAPLALPRKSIQRPPGLLGLRHSNSSGNLASSPNATGARASFSSSINSARSPVTPGAPHSPTFSAPGDVKTKLVQRLVSCFIENGEPAAESETVCRQVVEECREDRDVVRTLYVFLKDPKNGVLRKRVLSGQIPPAQLIRMKEKELMAPDDLKKFEEEAQIRLRDRDMEQIAAARKTSSKLFKCKKCKKNDTNFYEMQTRSADEPMTIFVQCNNCGNRWKE